MSKKIVDILLEVHESQYLQEIADRLVPLGWTIMSKSQGDHPQISLNKGYTEQGYAERVYHLHMRIKGDWSELYFRDYLMEHESVSKEYEALKLELAKMYKNDRDEYTQQKTEFVKTYSSLAKDVYQNRYMPDSSND